MRLIIFLTALLTVVCCWVARGQTGTTVAYVIGFEDREILEAYEDGNTR